MESDTLKHSLGYGGSGCDSLSIADYTSKQKNIKRGLLSLHPLYQYKLICAGDNLTLY